MPKRRDEAPDLMEYIKSLEQRIRNLEAGRRIGFTSVDAGSLNLSSGTLKVGSNVYFGPVTLGSDTSPGWIFRRGDGTLLFYLAGPDGANQYFAFLDAKGNIIMADDYISDQGLARPYIPIPFTDHSNTIPTVTTTSGSFVSLLTGRYQKQHPKAVVQVLCRSSDGTTTGEVQIREGLTGAILTAAPTTIAASSYALQTLGPFVVNGNHMDYVELEVQARRTAGAGTIGVRVMLAMGVQS